MTEDKNNGDRDLAEKNDDDKIKINLRYKITEGSNIFKTKGLAETLPREG